MPKQTRGNPRARASKSAGELLEAAARSGLTRVEARLLLQHATGWSREQLLAHPDWQVGTAGRRSFEGLVARRRHSEPIAYLLGGREFYGRSFKIDRRALIPRPETELLVELGRAAVREWRRGGIEPVVLDVGTGSGAVAISMSLECGVSVVGTDMSAEALSLAAENAYHLSAERVRLVRSDLLGTFRGPLHVVLANLPYVPSSRSLPADVGEYEPSVALFGGERGTELIERLLREAQPLLATGATLAVELDEQEQADAVAAFARAMYPSAEVSVFQDAGGYDRVVRVVTV